MDMTIRLSLLLVIILCSCNPFITKHDLYEPLASLEKDEPVHLKNSLEWWYFTGHLEGEDGNTYGIEYVFFHFTTFGGRSNYMINFALSNPQNNEFYYDYDFFGSSKTPEAGVLPLDLVKGPYSLKGQNGSYFLNAEMQNNSIGINLNTVPTREAVFQNGTGYEQYGDLTSAGYYSFPRLDTQGEVIINDTSVKVKGELWYDRQWNCGSNLINGKVSWDWMSVQFNEDKEELMVYRVEDRKKEVEIYGGSFHKSNGEIVDLEDGELSMTPVSYWESPDSKRQYPYKWRVQIPSLEIDIEVEASFPHQELILNRMGFKLPYWEGMCEVKGTREGAEITGDAYLEMTNKGKKLPPMVIEEATPQEMQTQK